MAAQVIRNIWAVGRNYAEHAKELGNTVPSTPMIFLKAGSTALESGHAIELPAWSKDVHHEIELAVEFGKDLKLVRACASLDLTARDVQNELKKNAHPWTLAKSFKHSSPIGAFFDIDSSTDLQNLVLRLTVNGEVRQQGSTCDMVFNVRDLARYVIERFPVEPGDLLLTGTPAGVSPLRAGDEVAAEVLNGSAIVSRGQWMVS